MLASGHWRVLRVISAITESSVGHRWSKLTLDTGLGLGDENHLASESS